MSRLHTLLEWIPSASNWADGISRKGLSNPWWHEHGFSVHTSTVFTPLWNSRLSGCCPAFCLFSLSAMGELSALGGDQDTTPREGGQSRQLP